MEKYKTILLAGPTASGKTDLAFNLAKRFNDAVIINADSMQVYDKIIILTARPPIEELKDYNHCLFGVVSPSEKFSTAIWLKLTNKILRECQRDNKSVIIVGGTGLYFKALIEGLSYIPDVSDDIQTRLNLKLEKAGVESLYKELLEVDYLAAQGIKPQDKHRILRALGVYYTTGKNISSFWEGDNEESLVDINKCLAIALQPDRELLYERINKRCDIMLDMGVIDEVKYLSKLTKAGDNDSEHSNIYKAIGVKEFSDYLNGELSYVDAYEKFKINSRRYAKRQFSWIRRYMRDWHKVSSLKLDEQINDLKNLKVIE